jgi:hypothetical protein
MRGPRMRYFFDVNEQSDDTGTDFPDRLSVQREAIAFILAVAAEGAFTERTLRLAVRDEQDKRVFAARLQLASGWTDEPGAAPV